MGDINMGRRTQLETDTRFSIPQARNLPKETKQRRSARTKRQATQLRS